MWLKNIFSASLVLATSFTLPSAASPTGHGLNTISGRSEPSAATFNNKTIFTSPSDYTVPGVLYARTAQLPNVSYFFSTW